MTLSMAAQGHRAARGFTMVPVARAFSPPQKAAGRADARRARKSFNDQRNAGGEPKAADISDQEYRVVAVVRGSR
jgi:hypothetical protein